MWIKKYKIYLIAYVCRYVKSSSQYTSLKCAHQNITELTSAYFLYCFRLLRKDAARSCKNWQRNRMRTHMHHLFHKLSTSKTTSNEVTQIMTLPWLECCHVGWLKQTAWLFKQLRFFFRTVVGGCLNCTIFDVCIGPDEVLYLRWNVFNASG